MTFTNCFARQLNMLHEHTLVYLGLHSKMPQAYVRTCRAIVAPLRVHLCACSSCNCLIDFYIALYIAWWIVGLGLSKWIVGTRHIQVLCGKYLAFYACSCLPLSYITQQQSTNELSAQHFYSLLGSRHKTDKRLI